MPKDNSNNLQVPIELASGQLADTVIAQTSFYSRAGSISNVLRVKEWSDKGIEIITHRVPPTISGSFQINSLERSRDSEARNKIQNLQPPASQ